MKRIILILVLVLNSVFVFAQVIPCEIGETLWYPDNDGDGYGGHRNPVCAVNQPTGYVDNSDDCNDNDSTVTTIGYTQYLDQDNDGYGDPSSSIVSCFIFPNYVLDNSDLCPDLYGDNFGCPATSIDENYIKTTSYQVETRDGINSTTSVPLESDDKLESITYYDGIGKPMQSISKQYGGDRQDIITPIIYDNFGRQKLEYLPYSRVNSSLLYEEQNNTFITNLNNQYLVKYPNDLDSSTPNPYSEKLFEASPLNRVLEQATPGNDWSMTSGNTKKFNYQTNTTSEVKIFLVSHPEGNTEKTELFYQGNYPSNSLSKTIEKNENWTSGNDYTIEEFKDNEGRIILKRIYDSSMGLGNEAHDTYYVYDDYGNLSYVLPPEASDEIDDTGPLGFRISSQTNYPWTDLVLVDKDFAEEYNKKLADYENEAILNADITNQYGGQGGFTVNTHDNEDLVTFSITFSADTPFELKQGQLVSLKDFGKYKDTELGKITGNDFEYVFVIKNNVISIEKSGKGDGKLTSINEIFNSDIKLSYTKNYPWTNYTDVDPKFAADYEKQLSSYPNSDILGINIPNQYGGQGGLNITIDENDNVFFTFNSSTTTPLKLKQGVVIPLNAKRKIDDRNDFETFQGYTFSIKDNNLHIKGNGLLTSINRTCGTISPPITPDTVEGLCYIYHYDYRNRVIEKKIPGKDWEYIVYDKLDRPILSQDANLRFENKWLFSKYDVYGRIIYTGIHTVMSTSIVTRTEMQNIIDGQINPSWHEIRENTPITINTVASTLTNPLIYYSSNSYPHNDLELLTINYYDDYNFGLDTSLNYQDSYGQTLSQNTKSMPTVNMARVLGTDHWIISATYYDDKAQPIYSVSKNEYLVTLDRSKYKLDFLGKVLEVNSFHEKMGQPSIEIIDTFTYDHANRMLTQIQTINDGAPELIVNNQYDEFGKLLTKSVGGLVTSVPEDSNGLQTINYNYNIHGWLKSINNGDVVGNDLFGFKLNYNSPEHSGVTPLYNGNISESYWKSSNDNNLRSYDYSYDALNRIKAANYHGNYALSTNPSEFENFSVNNISYDKNGNILSLQRYGTIGTSSQVTDIIDQLQYTYSPKSNKLLSVLDNGVIKEGFKDRNTFDYDYQYDSNGNMTIDRNKGILNISYNHLNLPVQVVFDTNLDTNIDGTIDYVYSAKGLKLEKNVTQGTNITKTKYAGNFVYEEVSSGEELKFFKHPEGYVESLVSGGFKYVYQYLDHLGNIRLSYKNIGTPSSPNLEIQEENNYYPFGLKHRGYNNVINGADHKYGFGGKEEQNELGLEWIDITARNYDPALGRWMNLDPLAEQMRRHSPYNYAFDNPIFYFDPDGMLPLGADPTVYEKNKLFSFDNWNKKPNELRNGNNLDISTTVNESESLQNEGSDDDITVNSKGIITKVVRNDKPNRFFDEDGNELFFNDQFGVDDVYANVFKYSVGERLFYSVSDKDMYGQIFKSGIISQRWAAKYGGVNSGGFWLWSLFSAANKGHGDYDFAEGYLANLIEDPSINMERNRARTTYNDGAGFFRFGNSNGIYNLYDAGNFMWGRAMRLSGFSYTEVRGGSQLNEAFRDSDADQKAIKKGFYGN